MYTDYNKLVEEKQCNQTMITVAMQFFYCIKSRNGHIMAILRVCSTRHNDHNRKINIEGCH